MAKNKYVKCPRCELNYMDERQEMCDVCKAELGMQSSVILDDDDIELDEELTKLCPICKRAYINIDEEMCDTCATAKANADMLDVNDEEWRNFLDDDPEEYVEDKIEIPLDELKEDEEKEDEDEDDVMESTDDDIEDDFDYDADIDDFEELDDDDEDEDEDDDDDEDEDEDEKPIRSTKKSKKK